MLNLQQIQELESKYGTSFFLFDIEKFKENYKKLERAFKSRYDSFIIGYSYKTNYLPFLCKELNRLGGYAEVVSRLEYDLALKIGVPPEKIIFNGPVKSRDDIETALENKSILNLDSSYEIDFVENYCLNHLNKQFKLGLRVNFNLSTKGLHRLQEDYKVSRFGFCVESGELHSALLRLQDIPNLTIVGLHGHFSTMDRSVGTYHEITKVLCQLAKQYLVDTLEYIDVGGGIYGELPKSFQLNAPTFDDYAEIICGTMQEEFKSIENKPKLVLEPGISMVANTFLFVAKVLDVKKVRNTSFVLVDGSVHNIRPTMHKRNLPLRHMKASKEHYENGSYHIVGYTCMEKDYLAYEVSGDIPKRNDYFVFENVGAYTIVFNPPFIKERPGILAVEQGKTFLVRKKEAMKQFFDDELYCLNELNQERVRNEYINL